MDPQNQATSQLYPQQTYPQQTYPQQTYPQQTYPQQNPLQPFGSSVVVVQQPIITRTMLGTKPQTVVCPNCRAQVISRVQYDSGSGTWVACVILFLFGFCLGCCLIPFCVDSCKDATHYCPNCNVSVGQRKFL